MTGEPAARQQRAGNQERSKTNTMRVDMVHLADSKPDMVAISHHSRKITYGEMEAKVQHFAGHFKSLGVNKGSKVALLSLNCPEFIFSYLGICRAGGVVVPINLMFTPGEIGYVLHDCGAEIIVVHPIIAEKFAGQSLSELGVKNIVILDEETVELIGAGPAVTGEDGDAESLAAILYTSGTTGKPKGAMLTHKNLISNVVQLRKSTIVTRYDNFLCVLPMFHSFAWTVCVLLPLYSGGTCVILETFHPSETMETIVNERITFVLAVPSMYGLLLKKAKAGQFSKVYVAITGGAALPKEIFYGFTKKFPVNFVEGYGLTEASPVVAVNPVAGIKKPGSIGMALPDVQVIIADESGKEVPQGVVGEILVKGDNVMQGYFHDAEASAAAIVNGWLRTGDLAYMDEDNYIFIVDRKTDLIIVSGFNVYPSEIEELLYSLPKVEEAAVIGVADPTRGEVPKAFLVVKEGQEMDKKEVLDFLKPNLAQYKLPREVEFAESLPKNVTGKVLKKVLRQQEETKG